jgi:predicted Zn-dependent peptidase
MDSWRTLEPYLEARDAATAEDLRGIAARYFIDTNRSVGVVLPRGEQE